MDKVQHDLSPLYRLPPEYGGGPPYDLLRLESSLVDQVIAQLSRAHDRLLSIHRTRIRQAHDALRDWNGPHAVQFIRYLNQPFLFPHGHPCPSTDRMADSMAEAISGLRELALRAAEMGFRIVIANAAHEAERWGATGGTGDLALWAWSRLGFQVPGWASNLRDMFRQGEVSTVQSLIARHVSDLHAEDRARRARDPKNPAPIETVDSAQVRRDVCSAVPNNLFAYADRMSKEDGSLVDEVAPSLQSVLNNLRSSVIDGRLRGLVPADLEHGRSLIAYGQVEEGIDRAVRDVGRGFLKAGNGTVPDHAPSPVDVLTIGPNDVGGFGGGEAAAIDKRIDADDLADQMREAVEAGDGAKVQALMDLLKAHQDDREWCAAFFQHLGADGTLKVAAYLKAMTTVTKNSLPTDPDPSRLPDFGRALASATNAPSWEPAFNHLIWGEQRPWDQKWVAVPLLQWGTYSTDYLTAAGEGHFLKDPKFPGADMDIFLEALARNPHAAAAYLNGRRDGKRRIELILGLGGNRLLGMAGSLAEAIRAVGNVGDAEASELLRTIGEHSDRLDYLGDDLIRTALAEVLAAHLTALLNDGTDDQAPWKHHLVELAELNAEGTVNQERFSVVTKAVEAWILVQLQSPDAYSDPGRASDLATHLGNVYALSIEPLLQSINRAGAEQFKHWRDVKTGAEGWALPTAFIPGVGEIAGPILAAISFIGGFFLESFDEEARKNASMNANEAKNLREKRLTGLVLAGAIIQDSSILPEDVKRAVSKEGGMDQALENVRNDDVKHPHSALGCHLGAVADRLTKISGDNPMSPAEEAILGKMKAAGKGFADHVGDSVAAGN